MKNILLLIQNSMQRNKVTVFSAFMCAFCLCMLMSLFSDMMGDNTITQIKIGVIDQDNTDLSADLKSYLTDTLDMQLIENESYDELSTKLINKRISVIIEIPANFEKEAVSGMSEDLITTSLNDFENAAFVDAYLNSYVSSRVLLGRSAGGDKDLFHQLLVESQSQIISVSNTEVPKLASGLADDGTLFISDSAYSNSFVGCMGFFLMFGFTFGISIAFMIFDDRSSGIFQRIQSTPVTSLQYIIGSTLFGVLNGLLIIVVFFAYLFLTRTDIGIPYGSAFLLMFLMMLIQVGFAMMLALLCKTKSAVLTIIFAYSSIGSMIGGAWFPIAFGPDSLQTLAKTTPSYWFMDSFVTMQQNPNASIVSNIIVLVLFILLVYLVSAIRFTQNKSA
jgi:ABC-2 type transport system permease protein